LRTKAFIQFGVSFKQDKPFIFIAGLKQRHISGSTQYICRDDAFTEHVSNSTCAMSHTAEKTALLAAALSLCNPVQGLSAWCSFDIGVLIYISVEVLRHLTVAADNYQFL
jgi:hypothetical protein